MAHIIKIKSRTASGEGAQLAAGELGYSHGSKDLYIGNSNADDNVLVCPDPTTLATKTELAAVVSGLDIKPSVAYASSTALLPAGAFSSGIYQGMTSGLLSIDGRNADNGDRVLLMDESDSKYNGIWEVIDKGSVSGKYQLVRPADFSDPAVTSGAFCFVEKGSVNANKGYVLTTADPITVNATELAFTQFSGVGIGANSFTDLSDTPEDYESAGLKYLRVNEAETAIEFADLAIPTIVDSPTNGETTKGISSNWAYDHNATGTNVHGAGEGNTLLYSNSDIDGGEWVGP